MAMPYFRLYTEARNDRKLATLPCQQFRTWFALLCYAAERETRGTIEPMPPDLLAIEVADGSLELLLDTLHRLEALQIIALDRPGAAEGELGAEAGAAAEAAPGLLGVTVVQFETRQGRPRGARPSEAPEEKRRRAAASYARRKGLQAPAQAPAPGSAPVCAPLRRAESAEAQTRAEPRRGPAENGHSAPILRGLDSPQTSAPQEPCKACANSARVCAVCATDEIRLEEKKRNIKTPLSPPTGGRGEGGLNFSSRETRRRDRDGLRPGERRRRELVEHFTKRAEERRRMLALEAMTAAGLDAGVSPGMELVGNGTC